MPNNSKLHKIMQTSPHLEMMIRRLYRNKFFYRLLSKKNKRSNSLSTKMIDFSKIIDYLKSIGINKGDILIVHSAYGPLKPSGLNPEQLVNELFSLVGKSGTLVMPVIRKYPESPSEEEVLSADIDNIVFNYNVKESRVWTGIIPKTLMYKNGSVTSRFPLNTITAYGSEAQNMIKNELSEDLPTANGINSAWKYCTDKNAWVISLGTDLTHSLTMIHTAEDLKKDKWPVKKWYRKKKFNIIDGEFKKEKIVLERHPRWGMLHFGERTLCKDLINEGIMASNQVEGILIESLRSKSLFDFLNRKNEKQKGYPYFWLNKYLIK